MSVVSPVYSVSVFTFVSPLYHPAKPCPYQQGWGSSVSFPSDPTVAEVGVTLPPFALNVIVGAAMVTLSITP